MILQVLSDPGQGDIAPMFGQPLRHVCEGPPIVLWGCVQQVSHQVAQDINNRILSFACD